jgi:hypothetical protein
MPHLPVPDKPLEEPVVHLLVEHAKLARQDEEERCAALVALLEPLGGLRVRAGSVEDERRRDREQSALEALDVGLVAPHLGD